MKTEIKLNEFTKPIGTYLDPLLSIGYLNTDENTQEVYFNDINEITELYDRYKYEIQNDWGTEEPPTIEEFLDTEYIYILLGCENGEGHEVLYS
tara:strand:+ start:108 stop:389 length:282 start_codon:yes stop_codon:yes gene_type:complete